MFHLTRSDAVWGGDAGITINYDRGKNWIEISSYPEKYPPDYAKQVDDYREFERVKTDGTKEKIRTNADAVTYEYRAGGSIEPIPQETNKKLVTVKGITMLYSEQGPGATIRMGKNPKLDGAESYSGFGFWKDGTKYAIYGTISHSKS